MNIIKIGGFKYKLEEVDHMARDDSSLGNSCGNSLTINLDHGLDKSLKAATLIHEIIEQINFINELDLEHHKITILANSLYEVINENDEMMKLYFHLVDNNKV